MPLPSQAPVEQASPVGHGAPTLIAVLQVPSLAQVPDLQGFKSTEHAPPEAPIAWQLPSDWHFMTWQASGAGPQLAPTATGAAQVPKFVHFPPG